MILFVLSVAVMNFGLGYALALALADSPLVPPGFFTRLKVYLRESGEAHVEFDALDTTPASLADLPPEWLSQLTAAECPPSTMLEGLLLKVWIELAPYREELLTAEVRGRIALGKLDLAALGQLLADVRTVRSDWCTFLEMVLTVLQKRFAMLGSEYSLGNRLDLLLDHERRRIESEQSDCAELQFDFEGEVSARRLLASIARGIDAVHQVRDDVQHLLAEKLRGEAAPRELGQPLYLDALTGQISRIGLEGLLEMWWQEDPQRLRLASCALIKIDRFARLNERLGARAGDRLLTALASLLAKAIRTDRGFDRVARFNGDTFLLFFGDTGPGNAAVGVERIRQSFEGLTLDYEGNEIDVSVSIGIASVLREDGVPELLNRVQAALANAERHGRNRTSVDHGEGPGPLFEPMRHPVRAQRVCIAAA